MVALLARSREVVRSADATALANGGICEGEPGLRPHYHPDYYGAYFATRMATSCVSAATSQRLPPNERANIAIPAGCTHPFATAPTALAGRC